MPRAIEAVELRVQVNWYYAIVECLGTYFPFVRVSSYVTEGVV